MPDMPLALQANGNGRSRHGVRPVQAQAEAPKPTPAAVEENLTPAGTSPLAKTNRPEGQEETEDGNDPTGI